MTNLTLLPIELQQNIYSYLTLKELFALNRMQISELESINTYIDYYFDSHKYKEKSRLKDCMFLMNFEEYKELMYEYLYELVSKIGIKFIDDINKVIPHKIYTIVITLMIKNLIKIEYSLTNIDFIENNNRIIYNFGYCNKPKYTRFINNNIYEITNELLNIIDVMRLDNRKIISIKYYSEYNEHDFIKSSSIITNEGFNLF